MELESQLKEANAERLALDQLYVDSLKNNLVIKKQLILQSQEINELKCKNAELQGKLDAANELHRSEN